MSPCSLVGKKNCEGFQFVASRKKGFCERFSNSRIPRLPRGCVLKEEMQNTVCSKDIQLARRNAKRNRAATACARCKSAKVKCSDYRPCKNCAETEYSDFCLAGTSQSSAKRARTANHESICRPSSLGEVAEPFCPSLNSAGTEVIHRSNEILLESLQARSNQDFLQQNSNISTADFRISPSPSIQNLDLPFPDFLQDHPSPQVLSHRIAACSTGDGSGLPSYLSSLIGPSCYSGIASSCSIPPPPESCRQRHPDFAHSQGAPPHLAWPLSSPTPMAILPAPFARQALPAAAAPVVLPSLQSVRQSLGLIPFLMSPSAPTFFVPSSGLLSALKWP